MALDWQYTDLVGVHRAGLVAYHDGHLHNGDPIRLEIWALCPYGPTGTGDDLRSVSWYRVALTYRTECFSHNVSSMADAESAAELLPALLNWLGWRGILPHHLK